MSRSRKAISLILVVMLIAFLFTACSDSQQDAAENTDEAVTETTTAEKTTLTFASMGPSSEQAYIDVVEEVIAEFNATNEYNVEIQTEWYGTDDYETKLTTLATQNELPDIFFVKPAARLQPYVEGGYCYSLQDALDTDTEWADSFNDGVFTDVSFDGEVYAIPSVVSVTMVYYNVDIFDQLGLTVPDTWAEFMDVCTTLVSNGITPLSMCADSWVIGRDLENLAVTIGGMDFYNGLADGSVLWNDDSLIEAGELWQTLDAMGVFGENYLGVSYDESREVFTRGDAAMYMMGTWDTSAVISGFETNGGNVSAFFLPGVVDGNNITCGTLDKCYAVSSTCANPEAAIAFLKMFSDEDIQKELIEATGMLPVISVDTDDLSLDTITQYCISTAPDFQLVLAMNVKFGNDLGGEFNNYAVAIAGGDDVVSTLNSLQEYASNLD